MRKVNIFLSQENVLDLTIALGHLGVLHLDETEAAEGWESMAGGYWSERADRYGSLERRLRNALDTLEVSREGVDAPDQLAPREDARLIEEEVRNVEEVLDDWQERKRAAERRVEYLELDVRGTRLLGPLEILRIIWNLARPLKDGFWPRDIGKAAVCPRPSTGDGRC